MKTPSTTRSLLFSAGSNAHGQLAQGTEDDGFCFRRCVFSGQDDGFPPYGSKIIQIAGGANHTLVLLGLANGEKQLWGSGDGRRGQLGAQYLHNFGTSQVLRHITLDDYVGFQVKNVAAAWETSYVVLSHDEKGDTLLSCGGNDFGDLGIGDLEHRKEIGAFHTIRFHHLLRAAAPLCIRISDLKAGPHNCIVRLKYQHMGCDETLTAAWGASRQGQLGEQSHPSKKPQSFVSSPSAIDVSDIRTVAVGNQHVVLLHDDATVTALGSNRKKQLCGLDSAKDISAIAATWSGTYLIKRSMGLNSEEDWRVFATGSNSHGQLGIPSPENTITTLQEVAFPFDFSEITTLDLICGSEHVVVRLRKSGGRQAGDERTEVWGWGWNEHGNLGLEHTGDVHQPTLLWPRGDLETQGEAVGVWAGCGTTFIAVESG